MQTKYENVYLCIMLLRFSGCAFCRGKIIGYCYHSFMIEEKIQCRWQFRSPLLKDRLLAGPEVLDCLLSSRGIKGDLVSRFLQPRLADLHRPDLLHGIEKSVSRILEAIQNDQPIVVYGDYDVDGVTASAILWHMITSIGGIVYTYVPHRIDEGYGLNDDAIKQLCAGDLTAASSHDSAQEEAGPNNAGKPLIISVDCGVTATSQAEIAKKFGVDLIITDHHEFDLDDLPDCFAIVHPGVHQDSAAPYPYRELCGAGVAFKLAWEIGKKYCGSDKLPKDLQILLLDLVSLAALGTVADVVPLVDENRVLVQFGLGQIKRTRICGLNAMIDAARLREESVDSYHVGFVLGPRLNACGRMGHAGKAVHLLTGADENEAKKISEFLTRENDNRRATEKEIVEQAKEKVYTQGFLVPQKRGIVVIDPAWHQGVVGIVASRLVDAYARPTIVLTVRDGVATGSARSVDGVNIHEALTNISHFLNSFGGHAMAAGMKLDLDNIDAFREAFVDQINQMLPEEDLVKKIWVDGIIELKSLTMPLVRSIEKMEPFGRDNPRPQFGIKGVRTQQMRRIGGGGKHLSMFVNQDGPSVKAVGFGMGDQAERLPLGGIFDIVVEPKLNTWKGKTSVELFIKDIKSSEI